MPVFQLTVQNTSESREMRTVRSQKKIHDADKAELLSLEETYSAVVALYKRTQFAAKMAKLKSKIDLYISKPSWQAEADKSNRTRKSYESEDVMRLLDARRLHDFFITKKNMIADSFHKGFLALPKGDDGAGLPCKIMK
jgi:hypothetical protein